MTSSSDHANASSSPLSGPPSDFDTWTPPRASSTQPLDDTVDTIDLDDASPSKITVKRKAPASQSTGGRASRRRRTGDDFEATLHELKADVILPKVKAVAQNSSRGKVSKQQVEPEVEVPEVVSSPAAPEDGADPAEELDAGPTDHPAAEEAAPKDEKDDKEAQTVLDTDEAAVGGVEDLKENIETPQSSSRPSRKRVAPTKLADAIDTPVKEVTSSKRSKQPLRGNWSANHLLTNPKSKLASCNLNVRDAHAP